MVMGKNPTDPVRDDALLKHHLPRVIACEVQHRYALVITIFAARIFSVAYRDNSISRVDISPLDAANLFLSHRRCDGIANDARHRNQLSWFALEKSDQVIEFALSGTPISFVRLADQTKA